MGVVRSVRLRSFKEQFHRLPEEIRREAREKYRLFLINPFHPSFHRKRIQSRRSGPVSHWEFRVNLSYRAACYMDGETYVWYFIGHHRNFDAMFGG